MSDVSGGNGSINSHHIYQQYWDFNNGDLSCGNCFIISHTLPQCNSSSSYNGINGDVEIFDVSVGNGAMNRHTIYQQNGQKPLINLNNRGDIEMNSDLKYCDMSREIG